MPPPEFEQIRERYGRACGYCGISEISAGGELTLDHHRPRSADGSDDLDNLVYACVKCNQYKHDFWPTAEDRAQQRRILHPLLDDVAHHIVLNEHTGHLEPLTETGRFHIALLRLNRPQLVKHRLSQQLQTVLREKQRLQEQQIAELQKTIEAQERYIALLQAQIERLQTTGS